MVFDFEKIDVYRLSLEVLDLSVEVAESVPRGQRHWATPNETSSIQHFTQGHGLNDSGTPGTQRRASGGPVLPQF